LWAGWPGWANFHQLGYFWRTIFNFLNFEGAKRNGNIEQILYSFSETNSLSHYLFEVFKNFIASKVIWCRSLELFKFHFYLIFGLFLATFKSWAIFFKSSSHPGRGGSNVQSSLYFSNYLRPILIFYNYFYS